MTNHQDVAQPDYSFPLEELGIQPPASASPEVLQAWCNEVSSVVSNHVHTIAPRALQHVWSYNAVLQVIDVTLTKVKDEFISEHLGG